MVFFQLSPIRLLTIYVAQGLAFIVFLVLAIVILKRDRKRLNVIFAGFYLSPVIGLFINFIYGPIANESLVTVLVYVTNFFIFVAPIFMVVFELILLKSEKVITTPKQLAILIGYAILMSGMFLFLFFPGSGIELVSWTPVWALPFFLYVVIIASIAFIPALFLAFKIYRKFEDVELQKKWRFFLYGFIAFAIFMYGIFISNYLNNSTLRLVMGIIGILCAIFGGYMMYYGVGRQIEK